MVFRPSLFLMRLLFFSSWFLLHNFACLQRNKEKHVLHLKLQQTLAGPLPLLLEAATSLLSLAKACMLQDPSCGPQWFTEELVFSSSAQPRGFFPRSVCLVPSKEERQGLTWCGVLTRCCLSVFAWWQRGNGRKGVRCPASPLLLTAQNCSCGSYSYHSVPALRLFSTSWLIWKGTNR